MFKVLLYVTILSSTVSVYAAHIIRVGANQKQLSLRGVNIEMRDGWLPLKKKGGGGIIPIFSRHVQLKLDQPAEVTIVLGDKTFLSSGKTHFAHSMSSKRVESYLAIIKTSDFKQIIEKKIQQSWEDRFTYAGNDESQTDTFSAVVGDLDLQFPTDDMSVTVLTGISPADFQKEKVFSLKENTAKELASSVNADFSSRKSRMEGLYPFFNSTELELLHALYSVLGLWHAGNFKKKDKVGCAQVNETYTQANSDFLYEVDSEGHESYWRTAKGMGDYLNHVGDIGCCTDFAFFLKAILDAKGFKTTKRLLLPGHWIVSVRIGEVYYLMDPSYGVFIKERIESLVLGKPRHAFILAHRNLKETFSYAKILAGIGIEGGTKLKASDVAHFPTYIDWQVYSKVGIPFNNEWNQILGN